MISSPYDYKNKTVNNTRNWPNFIFLYNFILSFDKQETANQVKMLSEQCLECIHKNPRVKQPKIIKKIILK